MATQVKINSNVNKMLNALVENQRKETPHLSITKQGLVNELIINAHKKTIKS